MYFFNFHLLYITQYNTILKTTYTIDNTCNTTNTCTYYAYIVNNTMFTRLTVLKISTLLYSI